MAKVGVGSAARVVLEATDDDADDDGVTTGVGVGVCISVGVGVVNGVLRETEKEGVLWTEDDDTLVDVSPADGVDCVKEELEIDEASSVGVDCGVEASEVEVVASEAE